MGKAREHICPPKCHICTLEGHRFLLPQCMGVAVYGSMAYCTCDGERMEQVDRIAALEHDVMVLGKQVEELANELRKAKSDAKTAS